MERTDPPKKPRAAPKPKAVPAAKRKSGKAEAGKPAAPARVFQRRRGGEAKGIGDLMPEIGRAAFRRFGFVQSSVVSRWPDIVGERYAAMARPESIAFPRGKKEEGTLNLIVASANAVLISHIEPEIIERVNRFFGYRAVAKIRYRHTRLPPVRSAEKRPDPPRTLRPVPAELGDSLRDIGDPELLAVLQSLAQSVAQSEEQKAPASTWPAKGNVRPVSFTALTGDGKKDQP